MMSLAKKLELKRRVLQRFKAMLEGNSSEKLRSVFDAAITHMRTAARERELDVLRHTHFHRTEKAHDAAQALQTMEEDQAVLSAFAYLFRHFRVSLPVAFDELLDLCRADLDELNAVVERSESE